VPLLYLITESRYVAPRERNTYIDNLLKEDELLMEACLPLGISCLRVDWADEHMDWSAADAILFRTPWDYFHRYQEFSAWLDRVSTLTRVINPKQLIRWNIDKHYLLDLADQGIPIVPSSFIEQGDMRSLHEICAASKWKEFILKPCISGAARHTYHIYSSEIASYEKIYRELITKEAMILQPYLASIKTRGEVSHMLMGGQYTHSIIKRAKGDDFRVQDDFGGTVAPYTADAAERSLAEFAFVASPSMPAYGRVDVMWNDAGALLVSEVEIIEPELWFRVCPDAAVLLAKHLKLLLA